MAIQTIPAHVDGATIEVFEPSQRQGQPEVVLDRFELLPGESLNYDLRSATAGFRYLPLGEETRRRLFEERGGELTPVGAGGIVNPDGILPKEEMEAGRARQQEVEEMQRKQEKAAKRGKEATAAVDRKAKDETRVGAAAQKEFARGVGERGEVARGSDEPHPGTPNELGQPVGSPAAHISTAGDFGVERTAATAPRVVSEPDQARVQQDAKREDARKANKQPRKGSRKGKK